MESTPISDRAGVPEGNPWENPYREYDLEDSDSFPSSGSDSDASWADGGSMLETSDNRESIETGLGWVDVCALDDLSVGAGTCALLDGKQVAVFRISLTEVRAVQNICPHKAAAVFHQGIVGDRGGVPVILCPLHKRAYSLNDGAGLDEEGSKLKTYRARIAGGRIVISG